MSKPVIANKVKLIVGLIAQEPLLFKRAENLLKKKFGSIDFESEITDFVWTDYYKEEFGLGLKRKFISFKSLVEQDALADIKLFTNRLEKRISSKGKRLVNIDPGLISLSKLILASTKDFVHRIYLKRGIFAEITLYYKGDCFNEGQWTYPDYRTAEYKDIFSKIREIYKNQLNDNC